MKTYETRSVTERRHSSLMKDALSRVEHDVLRTVIEGDGIPDAWQEIAQTGGPSAKRDRVHMRLDRDVIRFFKSMGPGYQERMACVLRAWMHGRLAKVIDGPDTTDIVLRPDKVAEQAAKTAEQVTYDLEAQRQKDEAYAERMKTQMAVHIALAKSGVEPPPWSDD